MEIVLAAKDVIKIRGKKGAIVIDPDKDVKTAADAVVFFRDSSYTLSKIEGGRVVIRGAGDYEVSGIKISGVGSKEEVFYTIRIDGMSLLLTESSALKTSQGESGESQMVIVKANESLDESKITALSPNVVMLYGEHALEIAKSLGKGSIAPVSKYAATLEKLPEEMEVVMLG